MAKQNGNSKPQIVASYGYTDESGNLLYQVVRYEPKDIRQRVPNGNAWTYSLNGTRRVLYRLPELVASHGIVWIVEGEKDADRLATLGLVATTAPMGAGKWRPEYSDSLRGRPVIIIPDNDEPGRDHAKAVRNALHDVAASVTIFELPNLPPKGDVSDWLNAGGDKGTLLALAQEAEARQTASDAYSEAQRGDAWEGPSHSGNGNGRSKNPGKNGVLLPLPPERNAGYESFPLNALPEPIRGYVDACSAAVGCDPAYIALPMLSMLAGAIGNTRRVMLKKGWTEPAIVWTAIVGESGMAKSPALDHARFFPRRRQSQARKRYAAATEKYEVEIEKHKADLKEWKDGDQAGERPMAPDKPILERALVDDTTIEALGPILLDNWRGVLILRDELAGWLGGFDRYAKASRGGGEAPKWIEMHGGRSISIDRRHGDPRTIFIPRAAVNIGGGVQPSILRRIITQDYRDNGLLARLLMAWPPRRARKWTEAEVDQSLTTAVQTVYDGLWELMPTSDEDGDLAPILVTLSPGAKFKFVEFVNAHGAEQFEMEGDLAAAWSKLEGYAARLALVHHLVRCAARDRLDSEAGIDTESILAGIALAQWFGGEDRRIYATLDETEQDTESRMLLELVQRRGERITVRELAHASRRYRGPGAAEAALEWLVKVGWGTWEVNPTDGRPATIFRLFNCGNGNGRSKNLGENGVLLPLPAEKWSL